MLKALGWIAVFFVVLIAVALSYRAFRQSQNSKALALALDSPSATNESAYVAIGGTQQWVQIRGSDRANPVLLLLHGGPGMSYIPFTRFFASRERHFTVVLWDRRGAGKTFARAGTAETGPITFDRLANDGIELTEFLRQRLNKQRIVLVGHSVGSVVGALMAMRRPDLYYAYVGTDQIVDMARNEATSYDMLVKRVAAGPDSALKRAVADVGPPPYVSADRWFRKQQLISATDPGVKSFENTLFPMILTAPDFSLLDTIAFGRGLQYSARALLKEMMSLDLRAQGLIFQIPIVFILGEHDLLDPTELAVEYYGEISAPNKKLVIIPGTGHNAMMIKPEAFLRELLTYVRPLAIDRTESTH